MQAPDISEDHFATHVRRLRQRSLFNRLQESLLFVPMLLLAAAIAIEELVAYLDRRLDVGPLAW